MQIPSQYLLCFSSWFNTDYNDTFEFTQRDLNTNLNIRKNINTNVNTRKNLTLYKGHPKPYETLLMDQDHFHRFHLEVKFPGILAWLPTIYDCIH